MSQRLKSAIVGVICLSTISFAGEVLHPFMAVGWFTLVQSGIEPAQKADYLSALFDSPLLKAYVCAAFAVMMGFVFGALSGAEKRFLPNMLFSVVAGVYVAFVTQSISAGLVLGSVVWVLCFLAALAAHTLRMLGLRQGLQSHRLKEQESFEEKVQKIRDKQRMAQQISPADKSRSLGPDRTN